MIVYALISPHPPIILPEIGGDELPKVRSTIDALTRAAQDLAAASPDRLIIISPHTGHGFDVPAYYAGAHLPKDIPTEQILVEVDSYRYYYELGLATGRRLRQDSSRTAIIASGDLSHVLLADGPYGFHPSGPILDRLIQQGIKTNNAEALLSIDPQILDEGAECGLRSILYLLGATENTSLWPQIRSYEAPFGVGYLVATYEPAHAIRANEITDLARRAIATYLETNERLDPPPQIPKFLQHPAGAFVTLHTRSGDLRGCIGTIQPTKPTLFEEVVSNAISASTSDPRFSPVMTSELAELNISVDVLTPPIDEPNVAQLDPKVYGIIVRTVDGRSGLLLPDLEGVTSAAQQIRICRDKGGIGPNEPITIAKFTVTRYEDQAAKSA